MRTFLRKWGWPNACDYCIFYKSTNVQLGVFHYNYGNVAHYEISDAQPLTQGKHTILFDFKFPRSRKLQDNGLYHNLLF